MEDNKCVSIDYEKENAKLRYELSETKKELEEYKKAILKLCQKL